MAANNGPHLESCLQPTTCRTFAGLTVFISGGSRGIGLAIARKIAADGANIVIAAKTAQPHPTLPGTIYTAAAEIEAVGGRCLAVEMDVRDEAAVERAVAAAVERFGGIDILINNASAVALTSTLDTGMKRFDLMHAINTRGTFLLSKVCIPHLRRSKHARILNMAPPLLMESQWFAPHVAYTMAKYGMSMCVLGMAAELESDGISVCALWPRISINTDAARITRPGADSVKSSRSSTIMADSAYLLLQRPVHASTGRFYIDEDVLAEAGITDLSSYAVDPSAQLQPSFFVPGVKYARYAKM